MTGVFTAGSVLTAANLNTAINSLTLNAQSGAGYTLVLTDAGKLVTVSNASAQNLTIPLNATVAYATGTTIEVLNIGAGTWTLTPTGGVTLTGSTSIPTSARVRLTKTGTDTWYANTLGGGGLTFITSSTFSASSAVNVNSCFTGAYNDYRVILTGTSIAAQLYMRLRLSSTDSITTYERDLYYIGASPGPTSASTQAEWLISYPGATSGAWSASIDLHNPASANTTVMEGAGANQLGAALFTGSHVTSTAYDGFSLIPSSGTITGTLRVYGYSNS